MNVFRIDFESMAWDPIRPDVRQKVYCEGGRQLRLVEFANDERLEQGEVFR